MKSDYNLFASAFSQTRQHSWPEFDLLQPLLHRGVRFLDVGCGNGRLRDSLDKAIIPAGNYFGFDLSKDLIGIARKNHPDDHFFQGSFAQKLPFGADNFEVVAAIASFHHLLSPKDQLKCLTELYRVLKPGGKIFLTTWKIPRKHIALNLKRRDFWLSRCKNYLVSFGQQKYPRYYRWVSQTDLKKLLKKTGFTVQRSSLERGRNWVLIAEKKL